MALGSPRQEAAFDESLCNVGSVVIARRYHILEEGNQTHLLPLSHPETRSQAAQAGPDPELTV